MTNEDPVQAAINDLSNAIVEFIDAKVREPKAQDWHLFMMDNLHSELTLAIAGFADAVRNDTLDSIAAEWKSRMDYIKGASIPGEG